MAGGSLIGIDGARIFVRDAGAGEPVMLLHGFPEDGESWRPVLERLSGVRAIVPDLPGYGASDALGSPDAYRIDRFADRLMRLADRLGLARFHLVGHDWGSAIGFTIAARHSDRIATFTGIDAPHPAALIGALGRDPVQTLRSFYIGVFQLPGLPERLLRAREFATMRRSLQRSSRPGTFSEAELDRLAEGWRDRLTDMLALYRALRLRGEPIGRVHVPTTILWGQRDRFVGPSLAAASAELCDRARIFVHPDATHWIHREEPDWVARHIARAIADAPLSSAASNP